MNKKAKKELREATRASVKKEMAKPRMAKSAREGKKQNELSNNALNVGIALTKSKDFFGEAET
jgi:hypothetical protein